MFLPHGISQPTYYTGRLSTAGWAVSDAKRLLALKDANANLKALLLEAMPDDALLKDVSPKMVRPSSSRNVASRDAGAGSYSAAMACCFALK